VIAHCCPRRYFAAIWATDARSYFANQLIIEKSRREHPAEVPSGARRASLLGIDKNADDNRADNAIEWSNDREIKNLRSERASTKARRDVSS
jgi:hypothetical protein